MPYKNRDELPENVKSVLPEHAQDIFKDAFNSAWEEYADPGKRRGNAGREDVARRVAWAAVKQKYKKSADGKWQTK
jgi:cation transport regulator